MYVQLARALQSEIQRGRLSPGARLPGSRALARQISVHRNTVLAAYQELEADGWIVARQGSGTFVSEALPTIDMPASAERRPIPYEPGFALPEGEVFDPLRGFPSPKQGTLMMDGLPDPRLMPVRLLAQAYRRALLSLGGSLLCYGDPAGHPQLREALADMIARRRGIAVSSEHILVTRGAQMALDLVARVLLRPGDLVAVEQLGYPPAFAALRSTGAQLVPLAVDPQGLQTQALAQLCRQGQVRAVYVTPHHQYPTTARLSPARRVELLELAARHRFAILEDDYDHEFHYDGAPALPLASIDEAGVTVYIGTLSKTLAPGLRVGFIAAPPALVQRLAHARAQIDRQGDLMLERAVADLMEEGELQRHIRHTRGVYNQRRHVLANALHKHLGDVLSFEVPAGGMAIWARANLDVDRWAVRAARRGVRCYPASAFVAPGQSAPPCLRLGFAALTPQEIEEAVARLASCVD